MSSKTAAVFSPKLKSSMRGRASANNVSISDLGIGTSPMRQSYELVHEQSMNLWRLEKGGKSLRGAGWEQIERHRKYQVHHQEQDANEPGRPACAGQERGRH